MKESFDPQERLERYEKEVHELQTQIRFLEDEVALLRRRLTNAPRQVKILEERLVQSRSDLSKALAAYVRRAKRGAKDHRNHQRSFLLAKIGGD